MSSSPAAHPVHTLAHTHLTMQQGTSRLSARVQGGGAVSW